MTRHFGLALIQHQTILRREYAAIEDNSCPLGKFAIQTLDRYEEMADFGPLCLSCNTRERAILDRARWVTSFWDAFLRNNSVEVLVTNESAYVDWGLPVWLALRRGIPVVHITAAGTRNRLMMRLLESPIDQWRQYDYVAIESFSGELGSVEVEHPAPGSLADLTADTIKVSGGYFLGVIMLHVPWDSALQYGQSFYRTHEDWLTDTVMIVGQLPGKWRVRLHPDEVEPSRAQTIDLVNRCIQECGFSNIEVDLGIQPLDDISVSVVVSMAGTCLVEYPARFGIFAVTPSSVGYAEQNFVVGSRTRDEYATALRRVSETRCVLSREEWDAAKRVWRTLASPLRNIYTVVDSRPSEACAPETSQ